MPFAEGRSSAEITAAGSPLRCLSHVSSCPRSSSASRVVVVTELGSVHSIFGSSSMARIMLDGGPSAHLARPGGVQVGPAAGRDAVPDRQAERQAEVLQLADV